MAWDNNVFVFILLVIALLFAQAAGYIKIPGLSLVTFAGIPENNSHIANYIANYNSTNGIFLPILTAKVLSIPIWLWFVNLIGVILIFRIGIAIRDFIKKPEKDVKDEDEEEVIYPPTDEKVQFEPTKQKVKFERSQYKPRKRFDANEKTEFD